MFSSLQGSNMAVLSEHSTRFASPSKQSGIFRRKWKKGTLKFTASDRCPHTFLHKINTSDVKIRPVLK